MFSYVYTSGFFVVNVKLYVNVDRLKDRKHRHRVNESIRPKRFKNVK